MVVVTMKNYVKNATVVLFVGLVLVNFSNAYAIKDPGSYTASFSGSSSSASAFSHASSSSYSFGGGNIAPQDLAVAKAGAVAGSVAGQAVAGAVAGSEAGSVAGSYGHSGANLAQSGQGSEAVGSSGAFSGSSAKIDAGSYKVIESPKYSTGYSGNGGNSKTNFAINGNYAQQQQGQQTAGGCHTCQQTAPVIVPLPLTPTTIHHSSSSSGSKSSSFQHTAGYQHISPSLIATFPGPSGSILDSKPVGAHSSTSSGSYNANSGSYNANAGSHNVAPIQTIEISKGAGLQGIISILPGPSGSIYDSKPVGSAHNNQNQAGSTIINHSASVPCSSPNKNCGGIHPVVVEQSPVVVPVVVSSHVFPGPSGSIHDSKPVGAIAGSSYNIPASHPVVGPVCSYSPGSPNKCGSSANAGSVSYNIPAPSGPSHVLPVNIHEAKPNAGTTSTSYNVPVGPSGTIHDSKPVEAVSSANAGAVSTSYNVPAGSVESPANVPDSSSGSGSITYNPHKSVPVPYKSVPVSTLPSTNSGTYFIDKPSVDIEPPLASAAPSFSGQIPCKDNNCGIIYQDKELSGQYQQINHDQAHLSGGIVYQNEDGSYSNSPTTSKPVYKNAEHGGYAVSNSEDHAGILIGPGTGSLPVEQSDKVPFGSGIGGSDTYEKKNAHFGFGTGGSHAQSGSDVKNVPFGFAAGGSHVESGSGVKTASIGADLTVPIGSGSHYPSHSQSGTDVKSAPGTSQVFGAGFAAAGSHAQTSSDVNTALLGSDKNVPTEYGVPESHKASSDCSGTNCDSSGAGFATGQVLINQGNNAYDVTNEIGANNKESGCKGGCSGQYQAFGASSGHNGGSSGQSQAFAVSSAQNGASSGHNHDFGVISGQNGASSGSLVNSLFGHGGLSGTGYQKFGGAYSSAGSYASAGSFAGASAHAGSYASSY